MHPSVATRLERLAPDQRVAATAEPGPVLCIAPAGSGKTTTLVARVAWLVDSGIDPATIAAITFNRRAAEELAERLREALGPLLDEGHSGGRSDESGPVRIRTFHALGLEILRDAGASVSPLLDRADVLRGMLPNASPADLRRLDTAISRLKVDLGVDPAAVATDPDAGPTARAFVAYERAIAEQGGLDFDDLVVRAVRLLEADPVLLARWRARCAHLLVDEAQDLDRMQLRLALLLAAPANRIFLVGDDDQSIYGWRLADVRRLLGLAESSLPGLRRVDLVTNYRCPAVVVRRAVRLVEHNRERFAKGIEARRDAPGSLVLAPTTAESVDMCAAVLRAWPGDDATCAILARTNRELLPAVAACLALEVPFRAADLELIVESPTVDQLVAQARERPAREPLLVRLANVRLWTHRPPVGGGDGGALAARDGAALAARDGAALAADAAEVAAALLSWAPRFADLDELGVAIADARVRITRLRRPDARLSLATAHGTKGLEFDHVAVIGMDEGRFPSARSIADAEDPRRALEEERRLAYVAWTRARRSLTLVYDPEAPSQFLREAFAPDELVELGGAA